MTASKTTILLVDDEPQFLEAIAERVRLKGFEVLTAENGAQALEVAAKHTIHLAVVDLKLPDMDGLMVITKIKENQPYVRTILLTGHGDNKLKQATESLNSTYFEKHEMSGFWAFLKNMTKLPAVLVIDDDPVFLETVAERIKINGFEVHTALSATDALHQAAETEFAFAVIDFKLPDMDGLEVVTKLKGLQPKLETILLTGYGSDKMRNATESLNTAYFEKSDMGSFWNHLRRALRHFEKTMAAAGMATGGDLDDAIKIDDGKEI
ncbi:MAG: response regulator [Proteobacteria bacterium]|nr:response regulator [Pseudomonadota bacterium]MBU1610416.1 response regulator [Pseudomonadota bacterium]